MKIFVTVGTTPFDSLIKHIDSNIINNYEIIAQISTGKYKPQHMEFFDYTSEIEKYYNWADIVVTHAGAGSVYKLLEKNKNIIVIPNLDRVDKHQLELAKYVEINNYAQVFYNLKDFKLNFNIKKNHYVKEKFFKIDEIIQSLDIVEKE